jgi:hypothetical protein
LCFKRRYIVSRKKKSGATAGKEPHPSQKEAPKSKGRWIYIALPVLALIVIVVGAGWLLTGSSDVDPAALSDAESTGPREIRLASVSQLSDKLKEAPPVVQEAYRFAIANPDVLSKMPCYCSCGNVGHTSNLDCFASEINADGSVVFDYHGLG